MPRATKELQKAYQREWKARRRADWFAGKVCAFCGGTDRLELDHIDPADKVDHKVWSWRKERRDAELAKCRPLCVTCHDQRHNEEKGWPLPHGTEARYTRHGCRCDVCRTGYSAIRKRRKAARAAVAGS